MSREKLTHAESGCGTIRAVVTAQQFLAEDNDDLASDCQELFRALSELGKTPNGKLAMFAICCAVLNMQADKTHYLFYVKNDGDIGLDVLSNERTRGLIASALSTAE